MNQWWQYWPRYFNAEECDKIIELALKHKPMEGKIGHATGVVNSNHNVRRSTVRWLPRYDPNFFQLFGTIDLLFNKANRNAFGFDLSMFHEIQFTEYDSSDKGTYSWHHDTVWTSSKLERRKLSMVIQLTEPEEYDGGRFEISTEDCKEPPDPQAILQRGSVIVFPSFLKHRVTPVTRGRRYSLVTWMEGPYFR